MKTKKNIQIKRFFKNDAGMTIVELMVAMTIFVVVITLAVAGFVSVTRLNTQAHTMTSVQQNGRILIEQLTRLSRSAEEVKISGTGDLQQIAFRNGIDTWICFKVDTSTIDKFILKKYDNEGCTTGNFSLTGTEVNVKNMTFKRREGIPPYLDIEITLESVSFAVGTTRNSIDINTTVLLGGVK